MVRGLYHQNTLDSLEESIEFIISIVAKMATMYFGV